MFSGIKIRSIGEILPLISEKKKKHAIIIRYLISFVSILCTAQPR